MARPLCVSCDVTYKHSLGDLKATQEASERPERVGSPRCWPRSRCPSSHSLSESCRLQFWQWTARLLRPRATALPPALPSSLKSANGL